MYYRSRIEKKAGEISLEDSFVDAELKEDVKQLVKLIVDDNKDNDPPLIQESFVIAIQGSWGTGKTWTAKAFINELIANEGFSDSKKFHMFMFDLLPFGNINESVRNILGNIGERLFLGGVVDARKELTQMAIDATPTQEASAGLSVLGFSFAKKINMNARYKENKLTMRQKFTKLSKEGHRFLVMLDDLDRMAPDEVVVVSRMVENFKDIPGFIFLLPFYRDAVANSIHEALKLDEASSHVFLRKFIKASVTIELSINSLKNTFMDEFHYGSHSRHNTAIHNRFELNTNELAWYVLLHILLVRETISGVGTDINGQNVNANYNNNEASNYLFELPQLLGKSKRPNQEPDVNTFPYATDGKFKRFADVYPQLSDNSDASGVISQLRSLLNEELITNDIYTDEGLIAQLRTNNEVDFDETRAASMSKKTVFEVVLLPLLQKTLSEPKLTAKYSRRDMQQLANAICKDPDFKITNNPVETLKNLTTITRKRFLEFR